jgi:invasion protein IalB
MLQKLRILRNPRLGVLFFFVGASISYAQDTAPLFSTPAGRSTTGAPILITPENQGNGAVQRFLNDRAKSQAPSEAVVNDRQKQQTAAKPLNANKNIGKAFGDWDMQCADQPKGERRCQIVGDVLSGDGKQVILVISLAPVPTTKNIAIQMAVPLGVAVQEGVKVDVEGAYSGSMPISRCTPQGCLVEGAIPVEMIEAMKAKSTALIGVTTPDGKGIPIALSLKGFGSAYEAVTNGGKSVQ